MPASSRLPKPSFTRAWVAAVSALAVATYIGSLVAVAGAADRSSSVVTLRASVTRLAFGAPLTLQGRATHGALVQLLSQPCGFTGMAQVAAKSAGRDGSFAFRLDPTLTTRFQAKVGNARSSSVTVRVAPLVAVSELSTHRFSVTVSVGAGHFFTGSEVLLQSRSSSSSGWRKVGSGTLRPASPLDALVALSRATVASAVATGAQVRAELPAEAAGSCFLPTTSPAIKA